MFIFSPGTKQSETMHHQKLLKLTYCSFSPELRNYTCMPWFDDAETSWYNSGRVQSHGKQVKQSL